MATIRTLNVKHKQTCKGLDWDTLATEYDWAVAQATRKWKERKLPTKPPKEAVDVWAGEVGKLWLSEEAQEVRRILKEAWEGKVA